MNLLRGAGLLEDGQNKGHDAGLRVPKQSSRQSISLALRPISFAIFCGVGWGSTSVAAEPPPSADLLEEIVVTAEKRDSTVQATPISMSAFSGQELQAAGITTVEELALAVPGVSTRTAGPGQTEYEMRGLTSSGGAAATVGFYLDETPLSASAVALNGRTVIDPELFDLNHAEVLRGPQGTLYGAGSMGGTIKLVTNPPKLGKFEGAVDLNGSDTTGGSLNGGGSLMLNLPISEMAALRSVTTEKYVSGWIDRIVIKPGDFPYPTNFGSCGPSYHCTRGDVQNAPVQQDIKGSNSMKFFSNREVLLIKPNDQFSATATFMYQRIDAAGFNTYSIPPGNLAFYQPYNVPEPYYDQFKLGSLTMSYDFGSAQLTSNTSYWQRDVIQTQDSTEALENIFNLTQFLATAWFENDQTSQASEELRLTSTGDGPFQWVGGVYYADLHSAYLGNERSPAYATALGCNLPYSGGSCPPGQTYNINNGGAAANPQGVIDQAIGPFNVLKQYAAFGEASYRLTSALKLTAGLRYFDYTSANISAICGVGTGTGNASCQGSSAKTNGNNILPKLNLSYTPTGDTTLYGTVSKGSRPGGDNLLIPLPTAAQLAANPNAYNCGPGSGPVYVTSQPYSYGPDSVWSFELGEKARSSDRRFTFNSDVYYVKWEDIQQVIALSCGYPYTANAGTGRTYGPEVEMSARIATGLDVSFAGAYTVATIYAPTPQSGITAGTRITNVPKYTGSVTLDYGWALSGDIKGSFRIADSLVGPVQDVAYVRETLPAYNLVNVRLGLAKDTWNAYLVGNNLTNKHAELTINDTTFAWQQPTFLRATSNQPRTIGFDVQYKF